MRASEVNQGHCEFYKTKFYVYLLDLSRCPKPHLYIPSTIILLLLCVWGDIKT